MFFHELSFSLDKASKIYENIIIMGDFNIDVKTKGMGFDKLDEFCDIFNLTNLITSDTCITKTSSSLIDLYLTNKPLSFQKSQVTETGLSDFHKLVTVFFKCSYSRLKPKVVTYRNYKKFDEQEFLNDLNSSNVSLKPDDPNQNYNTLTKVFADTVNKHAPLKKKTLRGNDAPFMNKEFRKEIYKRSRLRNIFCQNPSNENEKAYKKQRNKCVSLRKKCIKGHLKNITDKGLSSNKDFWKFVKPFVSDKGFSQNNEIILIENNDVIKKETELVELFNNYYIDIVETISGVKPEIIEDSTPNVSGKDAISKIVNKYQSHSSILKIQQKFNKSFLSNKDGFCFENIDINTVKKHILNLNIKKSVGIDTIPPKLVKIAVDFVAPILTKSINTSIKTNIFPEKAKTATVIPLDKGKLNKNEISNFRPVSVLNVFSKIYELVIQEQLTKTVEELFSPYISAYRKNYSTQHVLIRLIENWKEKLDQNFYVGAIITDLLKAFDCIPHDLLIAKLSAYGFSMNSLCYINSYLKGRTQCVRINSTKSAFKKILSGVPQGSILGPILFNLSINDLFFFIKKASVFNFADDNTLSAFSNTTLNLKNILESEANITISWLKDNKMIVNPDKFQFILLDKRKSDHTNEIINIDNQQLKAVSSVKLLGVTLDDKLNFNPHISNLCRSAANQLNALMRLKHLLNPEERKILIESYFISNFVYCSLVWMFSHAKSLNKIECLQKRALRFLLNDFTSSYEQLLEKSGKSKMCTNRLRILCIEIFKSINNINPTFMKEIFNLRITDRPIRECYRNNLELQTFNQVTFGKNSLRVYGPKVWNGLPSNIKVLEDLKSFKKEIRKWESFV